MKKTMRINARYALAAILSIMLLIALCGFAAGAVKSADATDAKQTTGYGTVYWTTADCGFITFTASGQERVFVLQGPSGAQTSLAVNKGETVSVALTDGTGIYSYLIGSYANSGSACRVDYKDSFVVDETNAALAP